jgi:hypothetical protein
MTAVDIDDIIYDYGTFYNANLSSIPKKGENSSRIIIYLNPSLETKRTFGSLEGHFISKYPLLIEDDSTSTPGNPILLRSQMDKFAEEYKGKFIPCGEIK